MVGLDLTKFKKVSGTAHKTVLQHQDGHQLHLDHKVLPSELGHELSRMPVTKLAKGGEADDPETQPTPILGSGRKAYEHGGDVQYDPSQAPPEQPDTSGEVATPENSDPNGIGNTQIGAGVGNKGIFSTLNSIRGGSTEVPPPPDPGGLNAYEDTLRGGQAMQEQGIQAQANAAGQQGNAEAQAAGQTVGQAQKMMQDYQNLNTHYLKEHDALMADLQNSHIDPNHFMSSRTEGQRTNAMIGLFLSGLGSGITGRPNMAQGILQGAIDRDMQAQEANLGTKKTLLGANMQMFGETRAAYQATRAQLQDIYNMRIAQAAAQSKNPQAQAIAQQEIGKSRMQIAQTYQQIAAQKALMAGGSNAPETRIRLIPDPKDRAKAIDEYGKAQNLSSQANTILGHFDQAAQDNTVLKTGAGLLRTPASVLNFNASVMPYLKDAEGRINEQEIHIIQQLAPKPGDSADKIAQKRNGVLQLIHEKSATPTLDLYGIGKPAVPRARTIKLGPVR